MASRGAQVGGWCCVVRVSPAPGEAAGALPRGGPWSGSGLLLSPSPGLVLCPAAPFAPLLPEAASPQQPALLRPRLPPAVQIHVLRPGRGGRSQAALRGGPDGGEEEARPALRCHPVAGELEGPERYEAAELLLLVPCRPFRRALGRVFGAGGEQWRFAAEDEGWEEDAEEPLRLLPWFALLRIPDDGAAAAAAAAAAPSCQPAALLRRGAPLLACGSPFGAFCPDLFLNTLSRGVVSNLAGEGHALILTDARCLPGTEGGGVFALHGAAAAPQLVGVIVAPLCWKAHEWVGLTLVCAVDLILEGIKEVLSKAHGFPTFSLPPVRPGPEAQKMGRLIGPVPQMLAAVALVECGHSWGSGVVVGSSLVLTCRHVVGGASRVLIRTGTSPGEMLVTKGKVVFATQDTSPYDVALVELEDSLSMFEPVLASKFYEGEEVSMVGFGAFGQACGPSVTSGILSAVITVEKKPVMLQATCAVHGGSSGGALFATRSGELLGIVASNTRDNSVGATYPHLNFSIPITVLQPALLEYIRRGDLCGFRELDRVADRVQVVWRLQKEPGEVPLSKL